MVVLKLKHGCLSDGYTVIPQDKMLSNFV